MTRYENHCCDCATGAYPCMGNSCPNRNVEVVYCDKCGCELDAEYEDIYEANGYEDLCADCLLEIFKKR
jgi:hypothetical protein